MSKREEILLAVMSALAGCAGVDVRIYRSRVIALGKGETPALIVEPNKDLANRGSVNRLNHDFTFSVMVLVDATAPDADADPIMIDAHNRVMANQALQSLVVDLLPISTEWSFYEATRTLLVANMIFQVTYQTSETNLTTV